MIQKSSIEKVAEIFFQEPTKIHFIREIGKKADISQTPVRNSIKLLEKEGIIKKKKAEPFDGFIADRDDERFRFYKRAYNILSLLDLKDYIYSKIHPISIVLFGSYSRGEDIESSDIDILVISKAKKDISFLKYEKQLKRKINMMIIENLEELDKIMKKKVYNGIVLQGGI